MIYRYDKSCLLFVGLVFTQEWYALKNIKSLEYHDKFFNFERS